VARTIHNAVATEAVNNSKYERGQKAGGGAVATGIDREHERLADLKLLLLSTRRALSSTKRCDQILAIGLLPGFPYSRDPTFHRVLTLNACNTRAIFL
jgi:hypothetical protein